MKDLHTTILQLDNALDEIIPMWGLIKFMVAFGIVSSIFKFLS